MIKTSAQLAYYKFAAQQQPQQQQLQPPAKPKQESLLPELNIHTLAKYSPFLDDIAAPIIRAVAR